MGGTQTRTCLAGLCIASRKTQFQQPFNIDKADNLGISLSDGENLLVYPPAGEQISVTFTLESWGNAKETYSGNCNATSGELYLTTSEHMYVITFGTPVAPLPPPK